LLAAVAITLPILLYQLWSFLAPAITEEAQRVVSVFVVLATGLFAGGVAFCYFIILPKALQFLTSFDDELYEIQIRASYYYSFTAITLLATGLAFQMPIFILALVRLRVLTAERLRRNRRIGIVLMVVFAVLLPTVDPVSLALEVVPLLLLFELSIWLSSVMERRWERTGDLEEDKPYLPA
jgi:sec-independent protein translocase protein TatC